MQNNPVNAITRRSAKKNAEAKRIKHMKNVRTRAELYSKFSKEIGNGRATDLAEWHQTLNGLSQGTAT